jgi:hypothetical protein
MRRGLRTEHQLSDGRETVCGALPGGWPSLAGVGVPAALGGGSPLREAEGLVLAVLHHLSYQYQVRNHHDEKITQLKQFYKSK